MPLVARGTTTMQGRSRARTLRLECKYDRANNDGGLELGPCCFWSRLRSLSSQPCSHSHLLELGRDLINLCLASVEQPMYVLDNNHNASQKLLAKTYHTAPLHSCTVALPRSYAQPSPYLIGPFASQSNRSNRSVGASATSVPERGRTWQPTTKST